MRLLRDEPPEVCFDLGRRLGTIFMTAAAPSLAGEWYTDMARFTRVTIDAGAVSEQLVAHVLSAPAARKLALVARNPPGMRRLAQEIAGDLFHIDLHGRLQARWLAAGFSLAQLPFARAKTARTALLRQAAGQLAPDATDAMVDALRGLKRRTTDAWLDAIREAGRRGLVSAEPMAPTDTSVPWLCAWRPLRLFISHSSKDKTLVRRLDSRLRERMTLDVFLDERDLRPGAVLDEILERRIAACDWLLVCASKHALASRWVEHEVELARRAHVPLMPVRLDEAPLSPQLVDVIHADLTTEFDAAAERLVAAISGNPVYPFLARNPSPALDAEIAVAQSRSVKTAELVLRLRARAAVRVDALLLTTIAQWSLEQPNVTTSIQPLRAPGDGVLVQRAPGARATARLDRALAVGQTHEVRWQLHTDFIEGNGMGRYPFLVGAELLLHDSDPIQLGVLLADLHGSEVVAHSQFARGFVAGRLPTEVAQEILRVLPATCAVDRSVLTNLREVAREA